MSVLFLTSQLCWSKDACRLSTFFCFSNLFFIFIFSKKIFFIFRWTTRHRTTFTRNRKTNVMNTIRWKTSSFIKMRIIANCKETVFSFFPSLSSHSSFLFHTQTGHSRWYVWQYLSFLLSFSPLSFIHRSLTFSHILSVSDCVIEKSMNIIFSYQEKWFNNWNHIHLFWESSFLTNDVLFFFFVQHSKVFDIYKKEIINHSK